MPEWNLPSLIDHTVLRPEATKADVLRLCREAKEYRFTVIFVVGGSRRLRSSRHPHWISLGGAHDKGQSRGSSGSRLARSFRAGHGHQCQPAEVRGL